MPLNSLTHHKSKPSLPPTATRNNICKFVHCLVLLISVPPDFHFCSASQQHMDQVYLIHKGWFLLWFALQPLNWCKNVSIIRSLVYIDVEIENEKTYWRSCPGLFTTLAACMFSNQLDLWDNGQLSLLKVIWKTFPGAIIEVGSPCICVLYSWFSTSLVVWNNMTAKVQKAALNLFSKSFQWLFPFFFEPLPL